MSLGRTELIDGVVNLSLWWSQLSVIICSEIAKFMGPTWSPPGCCRPKMGPMNLAVRVYIGMALENKTMEPPVFIRLYPLGCVQKSDFPSPPFQLDMSYGFSGDQLQNIMMLLHVSAYWCSQPVSVHGCILLDIQITTTKTFIGTVSFFMTQKA